MKTVADYNFKGKKVIVRVDFNVPLNHNRQVTDDTRIRESLPTINKIINDGGSVILISHLGRPKGGFEMDYSLTPIVPVLTKYLNKPIVFTRDLYGPRTVDECGKLQPGDVVLLENFRFYPEEEDADEEFAKKIASLGDAYVNDAFATSHRAHMSTFTLAKFFPNDKYFGLLLAHEVNNLNKILHNAQHSFTAIIGGAKVSTKLAVIKNLLGKIDNLIIGGGMRFTFAKALNGKIGNSLYEEKNIKDATEIINGTIQHGINLYIPEDSVVADAFSDDSQTKICSTFDIPDGWEGMDIGPKSIRKCAEIINSSQTVLWNGPLGVFEMSNFRKGTKSVAIACANANMKGAFTVIGGGDSIAAINMFDLADQFSFVSTGGGAMLEYIEGRTLPGVQALLD